jgi:uncharacterized protein
MTVPATTKESSMTEAVTDEVVVQTFRGERVDHDSVAHYRGRLDRKLLVNRCGEPGCGTWHHPPRPICPSCWSSNVVATEVSGHGTIFMAIFLYQGPPAPGVDYATPHPVVTVELDEQIGLRFTSTVIDADNSEIVIGKRVTLDWVDREGAPFPVFRLAGAAS